MDAASPTVFVWETNDAVYCELKLALRSTTGDVRTRAREQGRRVHEDLEAAITSTGLPTITSLEEAKELRAKGRTILLPEVALFSEGRRIQGRADLVIWGDTLDFFELKSGVVPTTRNRPLDTLAFESDATQALAYGLLLEETFRCVPRLWVVYADAERIAKLRRHVSKTPGADAILTALHETGPVPVPYTPANRAHVGRVIDTVRRIKGQPDAAHGSHDVTAKCRSCAFRDGCPERLA